MKKLPPITPSSTKTVANTTDHSQSQTSSYGSSSTMLSNQHMLQLQKKLGNQAVSQLIRANSNLQLLATPTSTGQVIQKVSDNQDHFQQFVVACAKDRTVPADILLLVKACAYILDHHSYKEIHKNLPLEYIPVKANIPDSGNAQDYLNIIQEFAKQAGHTTSKITWGNLTKDGIGTGVHVLFGKNGHAEGSPTGVSTPWMEQLSKRRDGTRTLYVMGHLLNAHLGGPGLDYNYVPLPGRAGWYGANDANSLHSNGIEQIVKAKHKLLGDGVENLEYSVQAIYPREPRTDQIKQLEEAYAEMKAMTSEFADVDTPLRNFSKEDKNTLKEFIQKIPNLQAMLYAVSSGNYFTKSWAVLTQAVLDNGNLWYLEDQYVPKQLDTYVKWTQHGTVQELRLTIPIHLPNSIGTPYDSNKTISKSKSAPVAHDSQFLNYVSKNSDIMTNASDQAKSVRYAARMMDLNEYDRELLLDLFQNIERFYEIDAKINSGSWSEEEQIKLSQLKEEYSVAFHILSSDPDMQQFASSEADAKIVMELLGKTSGMLFRGIQSYVHEVNPTKPLSEFISEGKTPWGSPSKVTAKLQKNGHPQGSSAGGDSSWMLKLEERADDKTLYVRGHMLNRHLGGAGLDHNMVPLTGRAGWYGANNANGLHSSGIEENVKTLYALLAEPGDANPAKVTNLVYTVEAVFGDHARPQTKYVQDLTTYYKQEIVQAILKEFTNKNENLNDDDHLIKFTNLAATTFNQLAATEPEEAKSLFIQKIYSMNKAKYGQGQDPSSDPLRSQIITDFNLQALDSEEKLITAWRDHIAPHDYGMQTRTVSSKMMAWKDLYKNFSEPIHALSIPEKDWVIAKVNAAEGLSHLLNAVSVNSDYLFSNILELQDNLIANANLWEFEDTNVPLFLRTRVTFNHEGGTQDSGDRDFPNVLPSDIRAPYRSRDES